MRKLKLINDVLKVFIYIVLIFSSCIDLTDSRNEIIKQETSGNGEKKCILFIKSGGATVVDSYQISMLLSNDKLKDSDVGNIFIADNYNYSISNDTSKVNFIWLSNDTLKISFDKSLRVFITKTKVSDVTIIYDSVNLIIIKETN